MSKIVRSIGPPLVGFLIGSLIGYLIGNTKCRSRLECRGDTSAQTSNEKEKPMALENKNKDWLIEQIRNRNPKLTITSLARNSEETLRGIAEGMGITDEGDKPSPPPDAGGIVDAVIRPIEEAAHTAADKAGDLFRRATVATSMPTAMEEELEQERRRITQLEQELQAERDRNTGRQNAQQPRTSQQPTPRERPQSLREGVRQSLDESVLRHTVENKVKTYLSRAEDRLDKTVHQYERTDVVNKLVEELLPLVRERVEMLVENGTRRTAAPAKAVIDLDDLIVDSVIAKVEQYGVSESTTPRPRLPRPQVEPIDRDAEAKPKRRKWFQNPNI